MKKITFSLLFMLLGLTGFSTTWTVTTPGFEFSPPTITIAFGDTVNFDIGKIHTVLEVSQATWNANGNTPLSGGFSLPLGGGLLFPDDLPVGTHFYVCEPHASMGMKGMIIVEGSTATEEIGLLSDVSVYPNPTDGKFHVVIGSTEFLDLYDLEVYDALGRQVYALSKLDPRVTTEIDLSQFESGAYLLKLYAGDRTYNKKILIE